MRTYSSLSSSVSAFPKELVGLYKIRTANMPTEVARSISYLDEVQGLVTERGGPSLRDREVLVVGCGQTPRELLGFGVTNRVTGIDLDVIPCGFDPRAYLQLLKQNGPLRVAKTIGRKALGVDRSYRKEMIKQLGLPSLRTPQILQMDATKMMFAPGSFDFVYSFSVFEHLGDPTSVLQEMHRVLRPGGVGHVSAHFWTSVSGSHDIRVFAGGIDAIPMWAHLRPGIKHLSTENTYLNYWTVAQYRALFETLPNAAVMLTYHDPDPAARLQAELLTLRAAGELTEYSDDELLGINYSVTWRKEL